MKSLLATLAVVAMVAAPASAAPILSDVADGPARAAVESLLKEGVVEGYPDGTFKGGRAATRFEVSQIAARLLAREQAAHASLAEQGELGELSDRVKQLSQELGGLETRTSALEVHVKSLYERRER